MNNLPLVSIITPFLNTDKFFEECIESVLKQTYNNWELVLVDDGSSDNSTKIAKHYADKYPEKIYYREHQNHQNCGASASRNLGIQTSQGEYIAFLDSDDIYLPSKLEDQVMLLNSYPQAGMLYAATEYWYSWTGLPEDAEKDSIWRSFGFLPDTTIEPPKLLTMFLQDGGTVPCMGSVLVRREAINSVGGWENSFKHIYTDQVFHAKICLNWTVYISNGCWDKYRQHPDSSCNIVKRTNTGYIAKYNYLVWLEKYLIKQGGFKNFELRNAFKKAMWPYKYKYLNKFMLKKNALLNIVRKKFRH